MKSKKNVYMIAFLLFFPLAGGTAAYMTLTKLSLDEPVVQEKQTTGFYAVNVSEIFAGRPATYKVTLENPEDATAEYTLKVRLDGNEVYNQKLVVKNRDVSEQDISFTPDLTGDYQKLEFLLYKNGEPYITRVLQILPSIDYSKVRAITPPSLQNGNMENNTAWNFSGKKFSGSYTASEWRSGQRSYQIKTPKGVEKGASGSIVQEFPSENVGFASLSFEVRSDNESYYIQSVVNDNVVWENTSGKNWTKIKTPVFLKKSNRIELKVIARNDTKSNITVWWDNVELENYSSAINESPVIKIPIQKKVDTVIVYNYSVVKNGSSIIYTFESGEKIELSPSDGNVSEGNAVYTTSSNGERIVFLGELHEKVLLNKVNHLYPVILDIKEKKLTLNETLPLKNNYAIMIEDIRTLDINDKRLKLGISRNNSRNTRIKEFFVKENSSLEYREEGGLNIQRPTEKLNYFEFNKKHKKIKILTTLINESDAMFNITQYGSKKIISPGDIYGEFQIVNITQDSIMMKNILPFDLTNVTGKQLSLMKGKIKIKVEK